MGQLNNSLVGWIAGALAGMSSEPISRMAWKGATKWLPDYLHTVNQLMKESASSDPEILVQFMRGKENTASSCASATESTIAPVVGMLLQLILHVLRLMRLMVLMLMRLMSLVVYML